jgi:LysR family cys regulon transcriptional activator
VNFQQLRIIRETVRRNFNLTEVANALYTSQSGVRKHIKDLEDELGVELFVRRGKRLLGMTEPGKELVAIVERMLLDAKNIKQLAQQYSLSDQGELIVATTHTQARYALPPVVAKFKKDFPKVRLVLHQSSPKEIATMLLDGQADIGVATEALIDTPDIVAFPYYSWHHAVVMPAGHALESAPKLTLETLADYPLTYNEGFTGRGKIDQAFASAGLAPDIVMSSLDADVIKSYVELGLGAGIIASMAFEPERDTNLRLLDATGLFPLNTSRIAVRQGRYLRGYAYRFIELCSPELTEAFIRSSVTPKGEPEVG